MWTEQQAYINESFFDATLCCESNTVYVCASRVRFAVANPLFVLLFSRAIKLLSFVDTLSTAPPKKGEYKINDKPVSTFIGENS